MPILTKDGRGVLFIHVPKTGGSSIENHFKAAGWQIAYHDGRIGPGTLNNFRWCTPQHMHGEMLQENFVLESFEAVFMVVREPLARFRSEYVWRRGTDVDTSERAVDRWARKILARYEENPFVLGNHIRPQAEYLVPGAEVFAFEDGLDAVVERLNAEHGFDLPPHVGRDRTSEKTSGVSSREVRISPELEDRLRDFYALDHLMFGY
ncbi:sulfotransferase family 2 domain-containing protein [Isoptericola sp. AK164]|uniref:sulfotransferase family 2 domain-containing protein n=1 Tax=Isoptericola sp. AK164 TaxID=3024246 RepID=UPI00241827CC|nr:sulfotransferase family 2 domain-containing protein [Isoptericola sp. AK164]